MSAGSPAPLRRRFRHRLEFAVVRVVAVVCGALPAVVADRAGALLGWVAARMGRPRWGVVTSQLRMAFPDATEGWRRTMGRRSYVHFGREAVAMFRLAGASRAEILKRTRLVGRELLEKAAREGRGVMVVSGHLGNWEVGAAGVVARGFPMDIIVARQRNRHFDRYLTRARERLGVGVIPRGDAPRAAFASLKAGRVVGLMGDQDARGAGVFVDFFGRPASTARGPAVLSMRAGVVLATFCAIRLPGWRPRYEVRIEAVPEVEPGSDRAAKVMTLTRAFTSRLEEQVRKQPCQYFWHHRRWKTPPPRADTAT
ncbi:MAG: lysophospholipid acyltransferase family protein [Gemmatimonadetes bacterium]|nr:lysophospholipid acyltransferase family protein [Gemmatimonadota bacterium]